MRKTQHATTLGHDTHHAGRCAHSAIRRDFVSLYMCKGPLNPSYHGLKALRKPPTVKVRTGSLSRYSITMPDPRNNLWPITCTSSQMQSQVRHELDTSCAALMPSRRRRATWVAAVLSTWCAVAATLLRWWWVLLSTVAALITAWMSTAVLGRSQYTCILCYRSYNTYLVVLVVVVISWAAVVTLCWTTIACLLSVSARWCTIAVPTLSTKASL
jgi:hypothetical protein